LSEAVAPSSATASRRYDLYTRGEVRLFFRYRDEGVILDSQDIRWMIDGLEEKRRYADIVSIRLTSGTVGDSDPIFTCEIRFFDGRVLNVTNAGSAGLAGDQERTLLYGKFVRDLHRRIPETEGARIRLMAGSSETRQKFLYAVLVIAGLFFVATPLVLLFMTGDLQALWIAGAGVAFLYPVIRTAIRNRPRTYNCDHVPDDLAPVRDPDSPHRE
jgi:hypothetical protein